MVMRAAVIRSSYSCGRSQRRRAVQFPGTASLCPPRRADRRAGRRFVDDSHIPIDDPQAIERVGRHPDTDMWGRSDGDKETGEWVAFTTDPQNHAYSWLVRHHPEHGRSVVLYRGRGAGSMHNDWFGDRPLLVRAGGYWWNGETWYRPRQVINWASERYMRRAVRQPTTITAADLLDSSCKTALGEVHKILPFDTRDEAGVPPPQATDGDRKRWSRPVVQDWIEQRRREPSNVVTVLSGGSEDQLTPGLRTLWKRLSEATFGGLWGDPASRRPWSRPHRNEQAVQSVADQVGWTAALHLESTVPFDALADTIEYAVLWELADRGEPYPSIGYIGLMPNTGRLLGWFIQHKPSRVPTGYGND